MKILCENYEIRERLKNGTEILMEECQRDTDKLEISVYFHEEEELVVSRQGNCMHITCKEPSHYYRGLNEALANLDGDTYENKETVYFERNGFMLDCSRNAVFTVEKIKSIIRMLAKMGMNVLMLYTEDTYEITDDPYFGIYRGRYTGSEIKEIDKYAEMFGIELVPCIQTLAHLHNALKWPGKNEIKDSADILYTGKEETYAFIEKLLLSVKENFSTKRVHLGMDEAVLLGLGNYLKDNGYEKSSVLIKRHCERVLEICRKLGLSPMIWSDMYITSNTGKGYYEIDGTEDTTCWEKPSKDVSLVYWDYYHNDKKTYEKMLDIHNRISDHVIFAGGSWIWNGIAPNYSKTIECTAAALETCKKYNIKEVICTAWMDNGAETPVDAVLPGLALFAHLGFSRNYDRKQMEKEFMNCTAGKLQDFMELDKFDSLFLNGMPNQNAENPSKYLLYQDPLTGIFDYYIEESEVDIKRYYEELKDKMNVCAGNSTAYRKLFLYYGKLAEVLAEKATLGVDLKEAYEKNNLVLLEEISEKEIPQIVKNLKKMKILREDLWMRDARAWGYELLDIKLGGVITRLESTGRRVGAYARGEIKSLEEMEQERLPYFEENADRRENRWSQIVSGSDLIDTI